MTPLPYRDTEAPSIGEQPEILLKNWRMLRRGDGTFRILAQLDDCALRISSAVETFDPAHRVAVTSSGRAYRFEAGPCRSATPWPLLNTDLVGRLLADAEDVSDGIWAECVARQVRVG